MSVDGVLRGSAFVLMLGAATLLQAEEQEAPDPAFIEYLGMWEESDEDWQMMDSKAIANVEEQAEKSPDEKESVEKEDEC